MFIVGVYYSWDIEMPMYIFNTEQEAKNFIKENFEKEKRIADEGKIHLKYFSHTDDFDWATIHYDNDSNEFMEWNIGSLKDMR